MHTHNSNHNTLISLVVFLTGTYRRKAKRDLTASSHLAVDGIDVLKAQEIILKEMGPDVCVFEKVCSEYAEATALAKKNHNKNKDNKDHMDWEKIIRCVL